MDQGIADSFWGSVHLDWSIRNRRRLRISLISAVELGLGSSQLLESFTAAQPKGTRKGCLQNFNEILMEIDWFINLGLVLTRTPEQPEEQPSRHGTAKPAHREGLTSWGSKPQVPGWRETAHHHTTSNSTDYQTISWKGQNAVCTNEFGQNDLMVSAT